MLMHGNGKSSALLSSVRIKVEDRDKSQCFLEESASPKVRRYISRSLKITNQYV